LDNNGTFIDTAPAGGRARAVEADEASLRCVSQRARPAQRFDKAIDEAKRGFEAHILRGARAWRPQMKTRDATRLRLLRLAICSRVTRLRSTRSRSGFKSLDLPDPFGGRRVLDLTCDLIRNKSINSSSLLDVHAVVADQP
jgi:hypothetical protein